MPANAICSFIHINISLYLLIYSELPTVELHREFINDYISFLTVFHMANIQTRIIWCIRYDRINVRNILELLIFSFHFQWIY